ncbi:hypothetical protein H0H92_002474 [Tricholoma furcatifolium]|nr:hypothetical protein H0H92_002474 [Tricholoma furcatifolium]
MPANGRIPMIGTSARSVTVNNGGNYYNGNANTYNSGSTHHEHRYGEDVTDQAQPSRNMRTHPTRGSDNAPNERYENNAPNERYENNAPNERYENNAPNERYENTWPSTRDSSRDQVSSSNTSLQSSTSMSRSPDPGHTANGSAQAPPRRPNKDNTCVMTNRSGKSSSSSRHIRAHHHKAPKALLLKGESLRAKPKRRRNRKEKLVDIESELGGGAWPTLSQRF